MSFLNSVYTLKDFNFFNAINEAIFATKTVDALCV